MWSGARGRHAWLVSKQANPDPPSQPVYKWTGAGLCVSLAKSPSTMRHCATLFFIALGAGWWQQAAAQQSLNVDNGIPWRGDYGPDQYCPSSGNDSFSFAYGLDFKYDDLDDIDFIGGNGVKLYCRDSSGAITGYINSLEGSNGEWQGFHSCPTNEHFNGFRLRVYPEQGTWGDDFAVDNIQLACSDGTVVDGIEGVTPPAPYRNIKREKYEGEVVRKWTEIMGRWVEVVHHRPDTKEARLNGNWGTWAYCSSGMHVMGIMTVVEEGHIDDDAGLTDVVLYCY